MHLLSESIPDEVSTLIDCSARIARCRHDGGLLAYFSRNRHSKDDKHPSSRCKGCENEALRSLLANDSLTFIAKMTNALARAARDARTRL